jgi:hypothetical protein
MQAIFVKDFVPREPKHAVVRISRIWENSDQEQRFYELGFIVFDQLVPCER